MIEDISLFKKTQEKLLSDVLQGREDSVSQRLVIKEAFVDFLNNDSN